MTPTVPRRTRFTWTDKVALGLGFAVLALFAFLWLLAVVTIGGAGAQHMLKMDGLRGIEFSLLITAALWVALQGIDFVARGLYRFATRNRGRATLAQGSSIEGRPFQGTVSAFAFESESAPQQPAYTAQMQCNMSDLPAP